MSVLPLVPPADRSTPGWHVSPVVDVLAYHFSWLWLLLPMVLAGDRHPTDYLTTWIVGSVLSFAHRHFTMPYVYLDGAVFRQHVFRFVALPVFLVAGFLAMPGLAKGRIPAHLLGPTDLLLFAGAVALFLLAWWEDRRGHTWSVGSIAAFSAVPVLAVVAWITRTWVTQHFAVTVGIAAAVALAAGITGFDAQKSLPDQSVVRRWSLPALAIGLAVAAVLATSLPGSWPAKATRTFPVVMVLATFGAAWNIWHVYMQKFGILRMYAAKQADVPPERRAPAWSDRWLVFGWLPFYFVWLAPSTRPLLKAHAPSVLGTIGPIADFFTSIGPYLFLPALACLLGSIGAFLYFENRATGLRSGPRLAAFLGMTGLASAFLWADPLKAYIAFGFSHAVEYIIFVWAFQRRRYAVPQPQQSPLAWLVQRPALLYIPLCTVLFGAVLYLDSSTLRATDLWRSWYGKDGGPRFFGVSGDALLFYWTIWHSFAHFYYDSFLWKMRMPAVRASL